MKERNILITTTLVLIVITVFVLINLPSFLNSHRITGRATSETNSLHGLELSVTVPEKYQRVQAGEMLQFQIELKNIQKAGRHDIQLDYYVKKNDIVIAHRRELKAVETQASFLSSIKVPEEVLQGLYDIEIVINEKIGALDTFYVRSSETIQIKAYLILILIAILSVGGVIIWELHKFVKKKK
jgi:hypothetical protein